MCKTQDREVENKDTAKVESQYVNRNTKTSERVERRRGWNRTPYGRGILGGASGGLQTTSWSAVRFHSANICFSRCTSRLLFSATFGGKATSKSANVAVNAAPPGVHLAENGSEPAASGTKLASAATLRGGAGGLPPVLGIASRRGQRSELSPRVSALGHVDAGGAGSGGVSGVFDTLCT